MTEIDSWEVIRNVMTTNSVNRESRDMNTDNESGPDCSIPPTDAQGVNNLCCCYALDEAGRYFDPCDMPVQSCCLSGEPLSGPQGTPSA